MGDVRFKARWRSNESRARFSEIIRETDGKRVRGDDKEHLASARNFYRCSRARSLFRKPCRFPCLRPFVLRLKKIIFFLFCKASAKNNRISFYCGMLFPWRQLVSLGDTWRPINACSGRKRRVTAGNRSVLWSMSVSVLWNMFVFDIAICMIYNKCDVKDYRKMIELLDCRLEQSLVVGGKHE